MNSSQTTRVMNQVAVPHLDERIHKGKRHRLCTPRDAEEAQFTCGRGNAEALAREGGSERELHTWSPLYMRRNAQVQASSARLARNSLKLGWKRRMSAMEINVRVFSGTEDPSESGGAASKPPVVIATQSVGDVDACFFSPQSNLRNAAPPTRHTPAAATQMTARDVALLTRPIPAG